MTGNPSTDRRTVCFYHSSDLDGKCSAAIVSLVVPGAVLVPINYGQEFPWETIARAETVIMVDFSLQPFSDMVRLADAGPDLVWIDHHKTALQDAAEAGWTAGTVQGIRRVGIGACVLTWESLLPAAPVPEAVRLLGEYDVWDHHDERCLPLQYGLRLCDNRPTSPVWGKVFHDDICEILNDGEIVLRYQQQQNKAASRAVCFDTVLDGVRLVAANYGPANSQFFDSVFDAAMHDAMCLFQWRPKANAWAVSLFSNEGGPDVGAICKARGGGGHKGAAGFQCSVLPFAPVVPTGVIKEALAVNMAVMNILCVLPERDHREGLVELILRRASNTVAVRMGDSLLDVLEWMAGEAAKGASASWLLRSRYGDQYL